MGAHCSMCSGPGWRRSPSAVSSTQESPPRLAVSVGATPSRWARTACFAPTETTRRCSSTPVGTAPAPGVLMPLDPPGSMHRCSACYPALTSTPSLPSPTPCLRFGSAIAPGSPGCCSTPPALACFSCSRTLATLVPHQASSCHCTPGAAHCRTTPMCTAWSPPVAKMRTAGSCILVVRAFCRGRS